MALRTLASVKCGPDGTCLIPPRAVPWSEWAKDGSGWIRVTVKADAGEYLGELSLLQVNLAWLSGSREKAVVEVVCKEK
jgi:hypothetical protein